MAFINQEVPRGFVFDPTVFFTPSTLSPLTPNWVRRWAVDTQNNIFLVQLRGEIPGGGGPKLPGLYAISFENFVIKFKARQTVTGNRKKGYTVQWEVFSFNLPPEKENLRKFVQEQITQALEAYGDAHAQPLHDVISVEVKFN